jgi:hypothetical protein
MRQHVPILVNQMTMSKRMNFKQLYIHVRRTNLDRGLVQGMIGVVDLGLARGHLKGNLIGCWEGVGYMYLIVLETTILVKLLDQGNRG